MIGGVLAMPLAAQQGRGDPVPRDYRPPPGMCRIWIDSVPPGRQPEPTDCPTALRRRPPNARVVFGDDVGRRGDERVRSLRGNNDRNDRKERARPQRANDDERREKPEKKEPEERGKKMGKRSPMFSPRN